MVDINLLPKTYRRNGETSPWTYAGAGLALLTLLLMAIPELVLGSIISGKQRTLDDQNAQIAQLNTTVTPRYTSLNSQKQQLSAVDQTMQALSATKTSYWSTDLANFVNNMPQQEDLNLLTLNMSEPAVSGPNQQAPLVGTQPVVRDFAVTGSAAAAGAVASFLNAYEQNNYAVDLQSTQRKTSGNVYSGNTSEATSASTTDVNYDFSAVVHRLGDAPGTVTPSAAAPGAAGTPAPAGSATPSAPAAPAAPAASGGSK